MDKIRINVPKVLSIIRADKKTTGIWCGIAAVVAVVVAFSIPRIYKSAVMLAPEDTSNGFSGNISSLASMVGMNMKFGNNGDAIYPEIYPDAMESTAFLVKLFPVKVTSKDGKIKDMPYSEYISMHQKQTWWSYPAQWLRVAIKAMTGGDNEGGPAGAAGNEPDPFYLTKKQFDICKAIGGNILCHVDKKTSVISITFTDQDPLIAATMANAVMTQLQEFITQYRTRKARHDAAYMEQLLKEAEKEYADSRHVYAAFCDANSDAMLQSVRTKMDALENDMQLKFNIYTQVVEQLQLARARVQERMPAFTTLQNATVPIKHSNTPKVFILAVFLMLAIGLRLAILAFRHYKEILS